MLRHLPVPIAMLRVILLAGALLQPALLEAQGNAGRVYLPTPETVAIYEFNGLSDVPDGGPLANGALISDLSGNGLDATVEGNTGGDLSVSTGDPNFDVPAGSNRECQRQIFNTHQARLAVNDDNDAFEMTIDDSFSVELYVNRETVTGSANWGILAGTWHSRNVLDDSQAPDNDGAWYGYGLIRNDVASNPTGEWSWVLSPVVEGVPRIGFGQDPEQHVGFFDIPQGRHYVVLSVDRTAQTATVYVDGSVAASRTISPDWSFTTPEGYEHARFLMFSGEDDPTRGSYRGSPAGTHLDAVRVQRTALSADQIGEIWSNIQNGASSPASDSSVRPILSASKTSVIPGQCVRLSGESSSPGAGQSITKYEWKVGAGAAFEEGGATKEVSFPTVNEAGVEVSLRVTNNLGTSAIAKTLIRVRTPTVTARVSVSLSGIPLLGKSLVIPVGSVLTLDGTPSSTDVPADALTCPLSDNVPVSPSPITEYRWDLDGRAVTIEDTRPSFDTAPFNTLGESRIALQVKNADGQSSSFTFVKVKVADSKGNTLVFHNTQDTFLHYEFSDLSSLNLGDPLPTGQVVKDLSPNGLDGTVEENDAGDLTVGDGSLVYESQTAANLEVRRPGFTGNNARIAVNNDGDIFEMTPDRSFSIELYVSREEVLGSANWGILAGTWHSRNVLDDAAVPETDGAWYGYGLIRNDRDANPPSEWSWVLSPVVNGVPRIGFGQDPEQHLQPFFDIPAGLHYVVLSVDRDAQRAAGYVDGVEVTRRESIPVDWAFTTPDGYEHARFLLFSGEDDPTRSAYRGSPAASGVDAVRVQGIALTPEQVTANWENICTGAGADPLAVPPEPKFHRGDSDDNGQLQLTDAVRILGFLFLGGAAPTCADAADADDNGQLQLTDAVRILGFLFLGQASPAPPGPPPQPCGVDPGATHLGCASYTRC
jgi:hypothetical protein